MNPYSPNNFNCTVHTVSLNTPSRPGTLFFMWTFGLTNFQNPSYYQPNRRIAFNFEPINPSKIPSSSNSPTAIFHTIPPGCVSPKLPPTRRPPFAHRTLSFLFLEPRAGIGNLYLQRGHTVLGRGTTGSAKPFARVCFALLPCPNAVCNMSNDKA